MDTTDFVISHVHENCEQDGNDNPPNPLTPKTDVSFSELDDHVSPEYIAGTFEGPEKTMEILFDKSHLLLQNDSKIRTIRSLERKDLDQICKLAKCTILTKICNEHCDAYVLSESSLFVYDYKLIMKTCGTTTLLRCLPLILNYADQLGLSLTWLGYNRKNLFLPSAQLWPHSTWDDEMEYLNKHTQLRNRLNGSGHILGPITGDHWFLYVADLDDQLHRQYSPMALSRSVSHASLASLGSLGSSPSVDNLSSLLPTAELSAAAAAVVVVEEELPADKLIVVQDDDMLLNMMMFDMAPAIASQFYLENTPEGGKQMTIKSGIDKLCDGAEIDETDFAPCGYSMNAIKDKAYYTIHVTPEPECSYVSFETNVFVNDYTELIRKVLNCFQPKRLLITLFGNEYTYSQIKQNPVDQKVIDLSVSENGIYKRNTLAFTQIDTEVKTYIASYILDINTATNRIKSMNSVNLPETLPVPEFPHGTRQQQIL
jgi:S-adenosylmethionine decarboxylase